MRKARKFWLDQSTSCEVWVPAIARYETVCGEKREAFCCTVNQVRLDKELQHDFRHVDLGEYDREGSCPETLYSGNGMLDSRRIGLGSKCSMLEILGKLGL